MVGSSLTSATAVLDVGKTNVKLLVFNKRFQVLGRQSMANQSLPGPPYPHLDVERVWRWWLDRLRDATARYAIEAIVVTTHASAPALIDDEELVLPIPDHETEPPDDIAGQYRRLAPDFQETLSPVLSGGLNLGQQLYWLQQSYGDAFRRARHILSYPQYWAWSLGGAPATEVTALGAHTHLWDPTAGRFSSLVDRMGWRDLFPSMRQAWDVMGHVRGDLARETGLKEDCRIICGIHDSNATCLLYRQGWQRSFALASTGTWIILLNPAMSLDRIDGDRDMLANVDATGRPLATARFMGGREHEILTSPVSHVEPTSADMQRLVSSGTYALPSVAPGGPFSARQGSVEGRPPSSAEERAALGAIYVALMTHCGFSLLDAHDDLIVDGGFAGNQLYVSILAALRPEQTVLASRVRDGTAIGAALLASWEPATVRLSLERVEPIKLDGLEDYADEWLSRAVQSG